MALHTTITIQPLGFEAPVATAAGELAKYLPQLARVSVELLPALGSMPARSSARIVIGTSDHLGGLGLGHLPKPNAFDDALAVIPKRGALYLAGSNPRSVLFAAYRWLEELGMVFLRPGPGGEVIPPRKSSLTLPVKVIREKASYRHRGVCIEGSPRLEHVLGLLDWMAKKKMNSFQIQFRHGGAFWRRGYAKSPEQPPETRSQELTLNDYLALDDRVVARMRELGMVLHKVGHGWTANVLGYPGMSWRELPDHPLPRNKRHWCALVSGKRGLFRNEPTNTELCYSNPEVREAFCREVLTYARQHSEVDYLQIWQSDALNNRCECTACRRRSSTDWYLMLIEELDRRLRAERLPMKLVFIAYHELIFPPERKWRLSDNVTMMYAPAGRCYMHVLDDANCGESHDLARPPLNQLRSLGGNRAASALARLWKQTNPPDSFLFDYHGWEEVWRDGLGMDLGDTMAKDMRAMKGLGFNGLLSCRCIRAFYPHPYMANAMADMMWDRCSDVSSHRRNIMSAAFGKSAEEVEGYLCWLTEATRVGSDYRHEIIFAEPAKHADRLSRIRDKAETARGRFRSLARREREEVAKTSLELMALHAEQTTRIARAYLAGLAGDSRLLAKMRAEYAKRLPEILAKFSLWVDPMLADPVWEAIAKAEQLVGSKG